MWVLALTDVAAGTACSQVRIASRSPRLWQGLWRLGQFHRHRPHRLPLVETEAVNRHDLHEDRAG
jgi:hypothetical protein